MRPARSDPGARDGDRIGEASREALRDILRRAEARTPDSGSEHRGAP